MKKILAFSAFALTLASCAPSVVIPPAASVTGYWTGSISKYGVSVSLSAHLQVTDSPNKGDFSGTGQVRGPINIDNASVTGNVNTGQLVATNGTDTVNCSGTFKNNNEYNGDCSYGSISAPLYMSRQSD